MKFFAALIAKLTGTAEAPRTLEQARATFGEVKAALDKVGAMFTGAKLDLDAMLAAGENSLAAHLQSLQSKIDEQSALAVAAHDKFTDIETKHQKASADLATAQEQLAAVSAQLSTLHSSLGLKAADPTGKPVADIEKAVREAFATHVASGVAQKLGELGIPAANLPKPDKSADASKTMSYEQFSKLTPAEKMQFSTNGGTLTDVPLRNN